MVQRDKFPSPGPLSDGAFSALPPVSQQPLSPAHEQRRSAPSPATSGRCAFCGSTDTFSVSPQSFREWAVERWGDAALLRCHDCGRRQAITGLGPLTAADWSLGRTALKAAAWTLALAGALALFLLLLRRTDEGPPAPTTFKLPKEKPSPSAPAPSPPSGPFSLRNTPTSAA